MVANRPILRASKFDILVNPDSLEAILPVKFFHVLLLLSEQSGLLILLVEFVEPPNEELFVHIRANGIQYYKDKEPKFEFLRELNQAKQIVVPTVIADDQVALVNHHEDHTAQVQWVGLNWLSKRLRDTKT